MASYTKSAAISLGPDGAAASPRTPSTRSRFSYSKETYIAFFAGFSILLSLLLHYGLRTHATFWEAPLVATLIVGGAPLLYDLLRRALAREFGSDLLAGISVVTAVLLHQYLVGAIVVLMLSGGAALEHYATRRASDVLEALAKRMPSIAHRQLESGIMDVPLSDISVGDPLVVLPHEICPVDGAVLAGRGVMDESYLTGEPFRISKTPGAEVLSGAINGETAITIVASKRPVDSRYARIMQVVRESEESRPRIRRVGDRLGAWYTPLALAVALFGWIWSGEPGRFLAVMVIATPCPLLIAIPVAIIGAISLAARRGIIIKSPSKLEQIDSCRTIIFDKTGTLTYGKPALTEITCAPGFSKEEVLAIAASLEVYSRHPLAGAILRAAQDARLELQSVSLVSEKPGAGLTGIVNGRPVEITGRSKLAAARRSVIETLPSPGEGLECLVFVNEIFAAAFRFRDEPRSETNPFVRHLSPRHGAAKVMLVSGDRESEVRYLASEVGITEVHSGKSPEEKVAIVKSETRQARTLFVGDGINDAPAMLAATVGVAFGQGSDITSEAADAVVLEPSLVKVDELMHIGRRMRTIALESALGGVALSLAGMIAAAAGYLPPVAGAVAQEIIDLAAVLNAVRTSLPFDKLTDF